VVCGDPVGEFDGVVLSLGDGLLGGELDPPYPDGDGVPEADELVDPDGDGLPYPPYPGGVVEPDGDVDGAYPYACFAAPTATEPGVCADDRVCAAIRADADAGIP